MYLFQTQLAEKVDYLSHLTLDVYCELYVASWIYKNSAPFCEAKESQLLPSSTLFWGLLLESSTRHCMDRWIIATDVYEFLLNFSFSLFCCKHCEGDIADIFCSCGFYSAWRKRKLKENADPKLLTRLICMLWENFKNEREEKAHSRAYFCHVIASSQGWGLV